MLSLRARLLRRGFAVTIRVLRALRGGLPTPDAPVEELEGYALAARAQLEDLGARLRPPRGTTIRDAEDAPVRSLWVVDDTARDEGRDGDAGSDGGEGSDGAEADPVADAERFVLYLHGGAYCLGTPELFRGLASHLSRVAHAAILLPDYRLAPEAPFPAALDDVIATWDWLVGDQGVDPARIAIAGDSAGAGLAAALCLRLAEEGRPGPACLAAISPWTDLAATGGSLETNRTADIWIPAELIATVARAYAGDRPLDDPLVSPLYGDLSSLPPTLVHVGTDEVLLDDAVRFVDRARAHGVDASVGRFPGLWHVFHAFPGFPESRDAVRELGGFVHRHTSAADDQLAA